jgi:predicted PurR-regulated permease PerM
MDGITEATAYFLQQGILGIIIVILATVFSTLLMWMQRRLDAKDKDIKALYDALNDLQEKRVGDNAQIISGFTKLGESNTNALSSVQKSIDGIVRALELGKLRE